MKRDSRTHLLGIEDRPVYDSVRRAPAMVEEALQAVRYRDLIKHLIRRDVLARYKRSVLGVAWTMLNRWE